MSELTLSTAAAETSKAQTQSVSKEVSEHLEAQSDENLRDLIREAAAILEGRTATRRREAIAAIHRLAKETGLTVSVKKPARKQGRPRKASPPSPENAKSI
jgi:hypothetical protein